MVLLVLLVGQIIIQVVAVDDGDPQVTGTGMALRPPLEVILLVRFAQAEADHGTAVPSDIPTAHYSTIISVEPDVVAAARHSTGVEGPAGTLAVCADTRITPDERHVDHGRRHRCRGGELPCGGYLMYPT